AVAVFSSNGVLAMANKAYSDLWGTDPNTTLADIGVLEATRRWIEFAAPSPVWGEVREFVMRPQQRAEWSAPVMLLDGRALDCRVVPIAGAATMVQFSIRSAAGQPPVLQQRA
ncbi:MAG: diguanylate cyclase, partial [Pseudomonadota bacterium]